jgi:para-aminobenzoate synthetase/4-amino-4-deoxychorismate lyase
MCFNVPIRTLTLTDGKGSMGIGAGIVHDSDPESEWRECLLKANFLTRSRPEFQLIETLCWLPDRGFLFLREHLERLESSAQYFFFQVSVHDVRHKLERAAAQFSDDCMRVRLLMHKDGRVEVTSSKLTTASLAEKELPAVSFSASKVDADDVFLFHKTTHRPLYTRERQRAEDRGLYEVLFMNTRGEVTEGTISTLFIQLHGKLYTPPVACGLLPGTFRRRYLESGKAEERVMEIDDIIEAEALYVANSVRGRVRVRLVDEKYEKQI